MAEQTENRPSLGDLAASVFAYSFQLKGGSDPGDAAKVKEKVMGLFAEFEQAARTSGYKDDYIQKAKYALVAYLDELVLSSNFEMKNDWAGSPLQLELFNDFAAGEEFYNKLKEVRAGQDGDSREVAGVYFLALTHGFKGMYIDLRGMEERKALMGQLSAELKQARTGNPTQLSPAWQAPDELPKLVRSAPVWLAPVVCAVVLILLVLVLAVSANWMADSAIKSLASGS
jgi:type VI secretion system protein ImpK